MAEVNIVGAAMTRFGKFPGRPSARSPRRR